MGTPVGANDAHSRFQGLSIGPLGTFKPVGCDGGPMIHLATVPMRGWQVARARDSVGDSAMRSGGNRSIQRRMVSSRPRAAYTAM